MNIIALSQNNYILYELYLTKIGSSWFIDTTYLFIISLLMLTSVILNLISLDVLFKIKNDNTLMFQFCFNCVFGAILNLLCIYIFAPRYFTAAHLILARGLKCKLMNFVYSISLYYGTLIDILIRMYRIAIFDQKCSIYERYSTFRKFQLL